MKNGIHEDVEIDLNWNLGRAWTHPSKTGEENVDSNDNTKNSTTKTTTVLDHLRNNLESDWHAAIRHAYLGPRLDDLEHGQLPDCFEADERATQNTNEILLLVSGRHELGSVRLRTATMLTESEKRAWIGQGQYNNSEVKGRDPALLAAFGVAEISAADQSDKGVILKNSKNGSSSGGESRKAKYGGDKFEKDDATTTNNTREPQILDLILDGELIATAVSRPASADSTDSDHDAVSETPSTLPSKGKLSGSSKIDSNQKADSDSESILGILTTYFYRGDSLLAQLVEEEPSLATTRRYSASKLLDPSGRHLFSIIRNSTPLVRHITFVAEQEREQQDDRTTDTANLNSNSNPSFVNKKTKMNRTVVARAQRAWLPPSSFWLFKPQSYDHDIGGWVITWAGESQWHHPMWLDPSVLTLVAALDTLDYEKAKQQPYGLFERLRRGVGSGGGGRGSGGGSDEEQGTSKDGSRRSGGGGRQVLEWVREMLRFHRGNK